jgi:hypothetical protein
MMADTASPTEKQAPAEIIAGVLAKVCFDPPRGSASDHARMHMGDARRILSELAEAGYVIVPREPTVEMMRTAVAISFMDGDAGTRYYRQWRAMIEAAGR